jgi:hypothetical protein
MTLHDASKRLATETELGAHAPALITLKRWSAARYLEGAKHFLPGRHHPLYNYAVIKEFCLQRLPVRDFAAVSYPAPVRPLLAQAPNEAGPSRDLLAPVQAVEPPEELTPEEVAPANPSRGGADTTDAAGDGAPLPHEVARHVLQENPRQVNECSEEHDLQKLHLIQRDAFNFFARPRINYDEQVSA